VSEAIAGPPAVVGDTIICTIELGVTITDAAVDETGDDDLLHSGGPRSALPRLRPRWATP